MRKQVTLEDRIDEIFKSNESDLKPQVLELLRTRTDAQISTNSGQRYILFTYLKKCGKRPPCNCSGKMKRAITALRQELQSELKAS